MIGAMPRKLPKFLHREITRHGRAIWYFRRGKGRRVRIPGEFGSVEFWAAYEAAANGARPAREGHTPGTFSAALRAYYASQTWAVLRPATQRMKRHVLNGVDSVLGKSKLKDWKRGDVAAGRDRRAAVRLRLRCSSSRCEVFSLGPSKPGSCPRIQPMASRSSRRQREASRLGPTTTLRPTAPAGRSGPASASPLRFCTRLAYAAATRFSHRRFRMSATASSRLATEKTGERVAIPVSDVLAVAIEAGPTGAMTFIAGGAGKPMTKESFGTIFREWCDAAGVSKSACAGVRKARPQRTRRTDTATPSLMRSSAGPAAKWPLITPAQ